MSGKYDDIIDLPHYQSRYRHHMSLHDRAAQFAPFAALTGYDLVIADQETVYVEKRDLSEDELARLNETVQKIRKNDRIRVEYYFMSQYHTTEGICDEVNLYEEYLKVNQIRIEFKDILNLELIVS